MCASSPKGHTGDPDLGLLLPCLPPPTAADGQHHLYLRLVPEQPLERGQVSAGVHWVGDAVCVHPHSSHSHSHSHSPSTSHARTLVLTLIFLILLFRYTTLKVTRLTPLVGSGAGSAQGSRICLTLGATSACPDLSSLCYDYAASGSCRCVVHVV